MSFHGQLCAGTACINLVACGTHPSNATQWNLMHKTIDGMQASNVVLAHLPAPAPKSGVPSSPSTVNCPGQSRSCHAWNPGYGDRNAVFRLDGALATGFTIATWPTNGSLPLGPNQLPFGLCLSSSTLANGGSVPATGDTTEMLPCGSKSLKFAYHAATSEMVVVTAVPTGTTLCLAAPAPAPPPPPGRPNHYYSCTANLAGGPRLPYPFCNASLDEATRLDDLLARATCTEKAQCITSSGATIDRLGVPQLGASEDTHGIVDHCIPAALLPSGTNSTGCPTTFPNGPGLGATFDRALWTAIGATMGREARGLNNYRVGPLYFLDPDINLLRDPRWGRAQEVPGEDPYLTGEYGTYIVRATQTSARDPRYLLAAGTIKHFQVYDMEGYQPNTDSTGIPADAKCDSHGGEHCGRSTFDASPPARDFAGYYMAGFQQVAQRAAPAAIMCAYNALFGVPSCANRANNEIARDAWGWDGFVISDCGAVSGIMGSHNYTHSASATIAAAMNQGGVDVNCGSSPPYYTQHVCDALNHGDIASTDLDRAARRYWRTMMRLGMFDPMEAQPYVTEIGAQDVDNEAGRELAQKTAAESLVLLKNSKSFLPLDGKNGRLDLHTAKIAIIGPLFNATQDLLSAPQYHGENTLVSSHSPLLVAQRRGLNVATRFAKGVNLCDWVPPGYPNQPCSRGRDGKDPHPLPPPDVSGIPAAVAAAKGADVAILVLGSDQTTGEIALNFCVLLPSNASLFPHPRAPPPFFTPFLVAEAENFDRRELGLVGAQEQLLDAITAVQPNVVIVLIHGGPIAVESAQASPAVRAIVDAFQPGELGADAIFDLLDGTTAPGGRMPYTSYFKNFTTRDIREVDMRAGEGTTYWWFQGPVLYPFGFGLSYTSWTFQWSDNPCLPTATATRIRTRTRTLLLPASSSEIVKSVSMMNHSVVVTNTGDRTSDIVALAFVVATPTSPDDMPLRKLFGFERFANVAPGESRSAYFASTADSLGVVGVDGAKRLHPGRYRIEIGGAEGQEAAGMELQLVGDTPLLVDANEWAQR